MITNVFYLTTKYVLEYLVLFKVTYFFISTLSTVSYYHSIFLKLKNYIYITKQTLQGIDAWKFMYIREFLINVKVFHVSTGCAAELTEGVMFQKPATRMGASSRKALIVINLIFQFLNYW